MEPEAELVRKYEQILSTMRAQIKSLKGKVVAAEEPFSLKTGASPSPVTCTQDFELVEFKEELVRKEFELEECLLELEEVKNELKKQLGRPVPPLHLHSSGRSEEGDLPHPPNALNWEDDVPVRDDLSDASKEMGDFAPDSAQPLPEVEILRHKIGVVERENRLLREKVDLCDTEIRTLLTRSGKPQTSDGKMRLLPPSHDTNFPEKVSKRGRETVKKPSAPQSRQRSLENYEQELATLRSDLAEKERLLAASSYRASQLADDLRQSRPGLTSLWQELKQELSRDIGSPRNSQIQRKLETLQGSVNASGMNQTAFATLLKEKEDALEDLGKRYNALMDQYQALLKGQSGQKPAETVVQTQDTAKLVTLLKEKETNLAEVTTQFNTLSEQLKSMVTAQTKEQADIREREIQTLRAQISQRDDAISEMQGKLAELSEQLTSLQSTPRQVTLVTPDEEAPPVNMTRTLPVPQAAVPGNPIARPASSTSLRTAPSPGGKKQGAVNATAALLAKKGGIAAKGKTGPVRTPR